MINPFEYLLTKIRLFIASKRTVAAKKAMENSIQHTRNATADIDHSYNCFLEKAKQQEVLAVKLKRLQRTKSSYSILNISLNTGSVTMTGPAEKELTKLDAELALTRHRCGDWGKADLTQWQANNKAARFGVGSIRSLYDCFGDKQFCVITDCDKQTTRICMEDEAWN